MTKSKYTLGFPAPCDRCGRRLTTRLECTDCRPLTDDEKRKQDASDEMLRKAVMYQRKAEALAVAARQAAANGLH